MKKVLIVIFIVFASLWVSGLAAGKVETSVSPDSIVTCSSLETYLVVFTSISTSVVTDSCAIEDQCAECIKSLENQGCKIVDLQIDHKLRDVGGEADWPQAFASYALSCTNP